MWSKIENPLYPKLYDGNCLPSANDLKTAEEIYSEDEIIEADAGWSDSSSKEDDEP